MVTKKTVRPKIKDKLPEKLSPVEPYTKEEERIIEVVNKSIEEGEQEGPKTEAETGKHYKEADDIAGKKEEQPFLFGEADQILNALETELSEWKDRKQKNLMSRMAINDKIDFADDRIEILSSAILATKKHAPMTEDPAVPEQIGETVVKVVEGLKPDPKPKPEKIHGISNIADLPKDQPETETPTPSDESAGMFRTQTQPLPDVLFLGDIITTSWNTGPYRVEEIVGPYTVVTKEDDDIPAPEHWSIKCSEAGAKRNKDGKLPKNHGYVYINLVVAVGNRFLSVHSESADEIFLVGRDLKEEPETTKDPTEEDLDL